MTDKAKLTQDWQADDIISIINAIELEKTEVTDINTPLHLEYWRSPVKTLQEPRERDAIPTTKSELRDITPSVYGRDRDAIQPSLIISTKMSIHFRPLDSNKLGPIGVFTKESLAEQLSNIVTPNHKQLRKTYMCERCKNDYLHRNVNIKVLHGVTHIICDTCLAEIRSNRTTTKE